MSFLFRLDDYARYKERVGEATYVDITRRTDPARVQRVWENLEAVFRTYGAPWVVQIWTKDALGTLRRGRALLIQMQDQGTTICAQVTVTGLGGSEWEPGTPSEPFAGVPDMVDQVGGPDQLVWRFDPVIPGVTTLDLFQNLARRAQDLGVARAVVNFIASPGRYKRVDKRLSALIPDWAEGLPGHDEAWKAQILEGMTHIAQEHGIQLGVCAESASLTQLVPGLRPAACGDHTWFVKLSGRDPGPAPTRGSRLGCGCAAYFDVGLYGQWSKCHRCVYCYAG